MINSDRASIATWRAELDGHSVLRGAKIEASRARRDGGGDGRSKSMTLIKGGAWLGERSWLRI